MSIPLDTLSMSGIGPIQIARFRQAGIADVHALASADAAQLEDVSLPDDLVADAVAAARRWLEQGGTAAPPPAMAVIPEPPLDPLDAAPLGAPLRSTRRIRIVRKMAKTARRHATVLPPGAARKTRKRLKTLRRRLRDDPTHWHRAGVALTELRDALHAFLQSTPDVDSARTLRRAIRAVLARHGV